MPNDVPSIDDLEGLESFDPAAFTADDQVPQDVCDFVLAIALVFNDFKDLLHLNLLLNTIKPEGPFKINRVNGAYSGITNHFMRLFLSLVREFLKVIYKNTNVIAHPFFISVIQSLSQDQRHAWNSIVESSQGKISDSQIGMFLLHVRDHIAYHYDIEQISLGYAHFFSSNVKGSERAYISRGDNMQKTRFFFADAAVLGCVNIGKEGYKGKDIIVDSISILGDLNLVLMDIVSHFIMKRKIQNKTIAFRPFEEEM